MGLSGVLEELSCARVRARAHAIMYSVYGRGVCGVGESLITFARWVSSGRTRDIER